MSGGAVRINAAAWSKLLRAVYDSAPSRGGPVALVALVNHLRGGAMELRAKLTDDRMIARGLGTWDRDQEALGLRLTSYIARLQAAASIVDDDDRLAAIELGASDPILRGAFAPGWFSGLSRDARARVRFDATDHGFLIGGDAGEVASLWNQIVAASDLAAEQPTWAPDWLSASISELAVQSEPSGPGEDPTAADAVKTALVAAATKAGDVFESVGGVKLAWILGGAALLALLVYVWRTR